jgi:phenylalanyl-tRNA synthetase beta chain
MAGLEVEEVTPVAAAFSGVVVAEILSTSPHPNADKLKVCSVSTGAAAPLQIVCGAPNAAAGMRVPLAQVGAVLPGIEIRAAKLRGVESFGMLCSARELGLSDDHAGLLPLAANAPLGADVRQVLELDDVYLTLKLTPNRGDCLGMYGVARELAAILALPFNPPGISAVVASDPTTLPVEVRAPDLCGRFSGRVVKDVRPDSPIPDWMRRRLERSGQRCISALVDISNYVMLELGRPSHIFDYDKVAEKLVVRWGQPGESVELLNGQTVSVDERVGVIADTRRVEALAGVMGGEATAVSDSTRNIFIEAAFWWPEAIAGRARRYGFATDAAHRFERGTDYASTALHVEYITRLVLEICGGNAGPLVDQVLRLPERAPVKVRYARMMRLIGCVIPRAECRAILERLACKVEEVADAFMVTPPSYRFDLNIEEDFVEEVARVHGFERVPASITRAATVMLAQGEGSRSRFAVRHHLAALGYQEVITYAFVEARWEHELAGNATPVALANPIASQMSVMRSSLLGGLIDTLKSNLNRGHERLRLFEIGRCFLADVPTLEAQPEKLGGLHHGARFPEQWGEGRDAIDFYAVKGDLECLCTGLTLEFRPGVHPALHPGRSAEIVHEGVVLGFVGELHPRWVQGYDLGSAPVVFELSVGPLLRRPAITFSPPSRMPTVRRDRAIVVDEAVTWDQLKGAVMPHLPATVRAVELFDIYRGPQLGAGKKSLAFRVLMQDTSRTLTDSEADRTLAEITEILVQRFAATVRA